MLTKREQCCFFIELFLTDVKFKSTLKNTGYSFSRTYRWILTALTQTEFNLIF